MKLTKNGYTIKKEDYTLDEIKKVKLDLTIKPFVLNAFGKQTDNKFTIYLESPSKLYIPRFYGLEKFGNPSINTLEGEKININFNGGLRKEQESIFDITYNQLLTKGGGIISLKCGGGKTVLALYLLCQLNYKTIVIVHKDFLMTQWYDRIKEFIPDAKIGKIQQNTIDVEGKDIILAMVQSLSMKEYHKDTFKPFGFAIFDECHHLGAEIFQKCMSKVQSKYMLGLSATPNRKDRCSKVFEWYIGPIAYMTKDKNKDYIEVNILNYECEDIKYNKTESMYNGKPCCPKMINNICNYLPRSNLIINEIKKLYEEGRDILYLSDRRENLNYIHKQLNIFNIDPGFYVGGMKPAGLRDSQEKRVILGTFSMASEGMDIPHLNTIILGSPKSDIVQSVGRILRQKKEKRKFHPLIYDVNDDFSIFKNQFKKRLKYYEKQNFDIYLIKDNIKNKYESTKKTKKTLDLTQCLL
tara:strand:- start:13190 stop:14593 length:1404 start_codon:yes stop_codon:yes gene_type:complete